MRFLISRPDNVMAIDNVTLSMDCSSLASTVKYVIWNENGSGFLEPSSGIGLRTPFSDPSPYQPLVNSWMTNQSSLTLAQAQQIKNELIVAIYMTQRQQPVNVTVTAGNYNWDATDDTVTRVIAPLSGFIYLDKHSSLVSDLNTMVTALDAWASHFNTLNTNFGNLGAGIQTTFNALVTEIHAAVTSAASYDTLNTTTTDPGLQNYLGSLANVTGPTTTAAAADSNLSSFTETFPVPSIQLIPVGQSTPVSLSPTDLAAIILAINSQNAAMQSIGLSKQAAVNALSSVSSVIAYDATTGW